MVRGCPKSNRGNWLIDSPIGKKHRVNANTRSLEGTAEEKARTYKSNSKGKNRACLVTFTLREQEGRAFSRQEHIPLDSRLSSLKMRGSKHNPQPGLRHPLPATPFR